ncbi:MAG TPA: GNVR domain-containing protein, partial [Pseudobacillus sp.]
VDNVSILTEAEASDSLAPVKPKPLLNIVIALVVGLMVGVGLAFLLEYMDNTVKTEQDVEKLLDLPVLGSVTVIDTPNEKKSPVSSKEKAIVRSETIGS